MHGRSVNWPREWRRVIAAQALLSAALVAGCGTVTERSMTHDAYIWQRRWSPELRRAMTEAQPMIRSWRILAAQVDRHGGFVRNSVDLEAVGSSQLPVVLVLRIEGQLEGWNRRTLVGASLELLDEWSRSGVEIAGMEIDHDCATRRLSEYALLLGELEEALRPEDLDLAITALPAWLGDRALAEVLAAVDEVVLQTHSVLSPEHGLFDRALAEEWTRAFAALRPPRFRVALPTYGHRVSFDAFGAVLAVESESRLGLERVRSRELYPNPSEVRGFMNRIEADPPSGFIGWAWFRLPTANDRRAWTMQTWRAVVEGRDLRAQVIARADATAIRHTFDVLVANVGQVDAELPQRLVVANPASCRAGDGLANYELRRHAGSLGFELARPELLRANAERVIGWVRCTEDEVKLHVE